VEAARPTFPNHAEKYAGTPLIRPEAIVSRLREDPELVIPESVILGYSTRLRPLLRQRGFTLVSGYSTPWHSVWLEAGQEVANVGVVEGFGFGAPGAAIVMEELASLGVRRFITLGFAGALAQSVDFGDVVLCTKAIRDEGVSHHYVPSARFAYPSESLTAELRTALAATNPPAFEGPTWTVDAIYRETIEEAQLYRDEGVLTVEMEAAALFTIAAVREVDVAGIFTVSDHLLASPEWRAAPDKRVVLDGLRRILDVALRVLSPAGDFELREVSDEVEGPDSPFA
jgi:uridine phosphorylase